MSLYIEVTASALLGNKDGLSSTLKKNKESQTVCEYEGLPIYLFISEHFVFARPSGNLLAPTKQTARQWIAPGCGSFSGIASLLHEYGDPTGNIDIEYDFESFVLRSQQQNSRPSLARLAEVSH